VRSWNETESFISNSVTVDNFGPGLPEFTWYNIPKRETICQITIKCTQWQQNLPWYSHKMHQIDIYYNHICHFKTLQNLPKSIFLVLKYAIWQPCFCRCCVVMSTSKLPTVKLSTSTFVLSILIVFIFYLVVSICFG
jgi:hypothetical protein